VPPESLSQIAGTEEPCIPLNALCWIAETDTNATHIYENQKEPTLTCADQDSMRAPKRYVISHTDNYDIAQQLLALMLQSVASGRSFPYNYLYSSYANPEKEAIRAAYRFWGRGIVIRRFSACLLRTHPAHPRSRDTKTALPLNSPGQHLPNYSPHISHTPVS
jgi:hypothetical protein